MKQSDVKALWGNAAGRCSFPNCNIELSPDGKTHPIGEMAHIVAESPNGPRGNSPLSPEKRDAYPNRILFCPNHHSMIDKDEQIYTVKKLLQMRQDHEKWVTEQLSNNKIIVPQMDNSIFINGRKTEWCNYAWPWIISSITPLNISNDVIDPISNNAVLNAINNLKLPEAISNNNIVNRRRSIPDTNGITNADFDIKQGRGHIFKIFRNGHCEFAICLGESTTNDTNYHFQLFPDRKGEGFHIFRYTDIAECFINQINGLKNIWCKGLPFNDMLFTAIITQTNKAILFSRDGGFRGPLIGTPINNKLLEYSSVINKDVNTDSFIELVIKRFVNYFGLHISDAIYDQKGELIRPGRL